MNPAISGRFLALPEASAVRHRPQHYPPRLSPTRCEPQQRCWRGNSSRRSGFGMPPSHHNTGINTSSRHHALPGSELLAGVTFLPNFQLGAEAVGAWVETLHPMCYIMYFFGAGVGLPFSEDAMVAWVGSQLTAGKYGSWEMSAVAIACVYVGVVGSDMVTFGIGRLLQRGMFPWLRNRLVASPTYDRAVSKIKTAGAAIGVVQRFSVGLRGPLCILAGFTGVRTKPFFLGACVGAIGTMALQVLLGYFLRNSPNVYLATLALIAAPTLAAPVIGSVMAGFSIFFAGKADKKHQQDNQVSSSQNTTA